jgi:DNA-binding CsgD family transcriptional regulator
VRYVSFVSAVVFTLALAEGAYILAVDPRGRVNRVFFGMTLCIAAWLLGAGLGYSSRTGEEERLWFRIAVSGFLLLHCCTLHFSLAYSDVLSRRAYRVVVPLVYLPSIAFLYLAWSGNLAYRAFMMDGEFRVGVTGVDSVSFVLLTIDYLAFSAASVAPLAFRARTNARRRDRKQAAIIAWSIVATAAACGIESFALPLLTARRGPTLSPLFSIVLLSGIAFAIRKYDFLSLNRVLRSKDILDHLNEAVILFDGRMRPVFRNRSARWVFPESESIEALVNEAASVRAEFLGVESSGKADFSCIVSSRRDPALRLDCRFSLVRDAQGETEGVLMAGKEIKDRRAFSGCFALSAAENRVLSMTMEGVRQAEIAERLDVSLRTVKAHCAHVYVKLGVHNRIELFRLLNEYNLLSRQESEDSATPMLLKRRPSS